MTHPAPALNAFGVTGIREVHAGDDLAALIVTALTPATLLDGDIAVISSKVVSKAEGRALSAPDRTNAIATQTVRVVAERMTPRGETRIVQARSGPVLAAAGVDDSNVPPGQVLLLPEDPDASARALRAGLHRLTGRRLGVVVSDTAGRPWRDGQTDMAIGAAGVAVVDDLRGAGDTYGQQLEVTVRALVDEIAALADLVKGKLNGIPVAVIRGLDSLVAADPGPAGDGPGAASLLRGPDGDWFRYGHVEAVRGALGVPPTGGNVPLPTVPAGTRQERFARAIEVALAGPALLGGRPPSLTVRLAGDILTLSGDDLWELAATAQRLVAAGWSEDVQVEVRRVPGSATALVIRALG